ncbi:MAG TPA: hypothetical protein VLD55_03005, partial [Candidatus Sulfobium mesophilum]|nr:hypothetical protein [Candidatus Sulfobium mesophilum]
VRHTGGGTGAAAIASSDASPKVTNVTVTVSPSSLCSVGIRNRNSSPIIAGARVTATGSGAAVSCVGIYNDTGSLPTIRNAAVTASAGNPNIGIFSGGDSTHPGRVRIYDSVIKATTNTISTPGEVIVMVFNAQMDGGGIIGTGTTHCVGVYDENYVLSPYGACP